MEFSIFPRKKYVREQLEQLVEIRLHTDHKTRGKEFEKLQLKMTALDGDATAGLPDSRNAATASRSS